MNDLHKGITAVLACDFPKAYTAFHQLYQTQDWEQRDLAVVGLGDILDRRIIEENKQLGTIILSNWQPTIRPAESIRTGRLLALMDGFLQPTLLEPNSIAERNTLQALRQTVKLLEQITLTDGHHLVRLSAILILDGMLTDEQSGFILPTFQRALKTEPNDDLRTILRQLIDAF